MCMCMTGRNHTCAQCAAVCLRAAAAEQPTPHARDGGKAHGDHGATACDHGATACDHGATACDHGATACDHGTTACDHGTTACDHGATACDHGTTACDHGATACDHGTTACDHGTTACDHGATACDHGATACWPLVPLPTGVDPRVNGSADADPGVRIIGAYIHVGGSLARCSAMPRGADVVSPLLMCCPSYHAAPCFPRCTALHCARCPQTPDCTAPHTALHPTLPCSPQRYGEQCVLRRPLWAGAHSHVLPHARRLTHHYQLWQGACCLRRGER